MAVILPVCCCQLRAWTGGCCVADASAQTPATATDLQRSDADVGCCCSDEGACDEHGQPDPLPECSGKSCCIKGFTPAPEWSPDVDDIGADLVVVSLDHAAWAMPTRGLIATHSAWRGPPGDDRATDPADRSLLRTRCALII